MSLRNTLNVGPIIVLLGSIILLITNTIIIIITEATPDTTIVYIQCGDATWAPNDPYGFLVADVLGDLVAYTDQVPGYSNSVSETIEGTQISCYAYASCNPDLVPEDCYECLEAAQQALETTCTYATSAEVIMVDCSMRFSKSST